MTEPKWLDEPEDHDYPAAADYLGLLWQKYAVEKTVGNLRKAPVTKHKAKDIIRAAGGDTLSHKSPAVERDLTKIEKGQHLSPVLLVRSTRGLIVADGWHRVNAVYYLDENAVVPAKLA